jgi:hypothetical protein
MVSGCGEGLAGALQGAGSRNERRILNIKNQKVWRLRIKECWAFSQGEEIWNTFKRRSNRYILKNTFKKKSVRNILKTPSKGRVRDTSFKTPVQDEEL